jgi:predicted patatin/cPLA2 family phospholipase
MSRTKSALIIQGGGMRGIYSIAALATLEELGMVNSFDKIYGSSSGAINAAYFLAQQAKEAITIYLDDISNTKFINPFRIKKIVNIDYLVDDILSHKKTLNVKKVRENKTELQINLFNYFNAETEIFTNKEEEYNFMDVMKATAALPILYNKQIKIKGNSYIDGSIEDGIPLFRAINDGYTEITVILTQPLSFREKPLSPLMRHIENVWMHNYPPKTKDKILNSINLFNQTMEYLENPPSSPIKLHIISPSNMKEMVSFGTIKRDKLLRCALMAKNDTKHVFN